MQVSVPPGLITLDAAHLTDTQAVCQRDTMHGRSGRVCRCAWMQVPASITAVHCAVAIQYSLPH